MRIRSDEMSLFWLKAEVDREMEAAMQFFWKLEEQMHYSLGKRIHVTILVLSLITM